MKFPSKNLDWLKPRMLAIIFLGMAALLAFTGDGFSWLNNPIWEGAVWGTWRLTWATLVAVALAIAVLVDARN